MVEDSSMKRLFLPGGGGGKIQFGVRTKNNVEMDVDLSQMVLYDVVT